MNATASDDLMPAIAEAPSDRQRLFARYVVGTLIDLLVLNLFAEYWDKVELHSFTISVLAAIVLQALMKATIAVEHVVAKPFKGKTGKLMVTLRFLCAWLVLFGSKFVILEALAFAFGDKVQFHGALHGLLALILVIVVMLLAEELVVRIYRRL